MLFIKALISTEKCNGGIPEHNIITIVQVL